MNNTSEPTEKIYPRVLIVYNSCINKADQHGVSIRGWFAEWPKEKLAQIYSGGDIGHERFCGYNFKLGPKERRFGTFFSRMKNSSLGESSRPVELVKNSRLEKYKFSSWPILKHRVSNILINTGLWELVFPPVLSDRMIEWIQEFNPDLIYAQGYHLSFTWLPVKIHKSLNIPICFQTGDDWPSFLYRNSIVSWFVRPFVNNAVHELLNRSSVRLSNSQKMSEVYHSRYQLDFEPIMMCDDINRFIKANPIRLVDADTISIIYSGGLGHNRWQSIVDLNNAIQRLNQSKYKFKIIVFTGSSPPEALNILDGISNIQVLPAPSHEELPSILKGADILFLPETFDKTEAEIIGLSVSTKAHLYMMAGRPILVYGSPETGIFDYALKSNWGCLVGRRDLSLLSECIEMLINNPIIGDDCVKRGFEVSAINHDATIIREYFRLALLRTVNQNQFT